MENINKKTMIIIVFGIIGILSIIIFMFLMNNMTEEKEDNNDYSKKSEVSTETSSTTTESKQETESTKEFNYDFERIKYLDICSLDVTECTAIIGTLTENGSTKILGIKTTYGNEFYEYTLLKEDKKLFSSKTKEYPVEFIRFNNKYLILVLESTTKERKFIMINNDGEKVLEEDYLIDDLVINENNTIGYKTLNCDLKDNYVYNALIKIISKKPKIVLGDSTDKTETELKCK